MIRYIQNEAHYTEVVKRIHRVRQYLWIGTADIKEQRLRTVAESAGGIDPPRCRGAVDSCQRAGTELRRRFRQISAAVEPIGAEVVSARTFQNIDLRLRDRLHRFRQSDWGWTRHERRDNPQFRSGHSDRRPCAGGCCCRPVRCRMARRTLQKMSSKKFLFGQN